MSTVAGSLYHTGKSRERLDNPAVLVCLHFELSYQQLLEFSFGGSVGCVIMCVLRGKVEKEEVIPKTVGPGPQLFFFDGVYQVPGVGNSLKSLAAWPGILPTLCGWKPKPGMS